MHAGPMTPLFAQGDPLTVAGVIGGVILGYYLGSRLRQIDPSAPGIFAILGGVFGSFLLRSVLSALAFIFVFVGPPVLLWYCRGVVRQFASSFGQAAGVQYARLLSRQTHRRKIREAVKEHRDRLDALFEERLPRDTLERLLEQERRRFDAELQSIGRDPQTNH